jgi:hypothetical protein
MVIVPVAGEPSGPTKLSVTVVVAWPKTNAGKQHTAATINHHRLTTLVRIMG